MPRKKQVLLLVLSLYSGLPLLAQDSLAYKFEIGNMWYRSEYTGYQQEKNYILEEVISDTLIHGIKFSKIKYVFRSGMYLNNPRTSYRYMSQDHNTVQYYAPEQDSIIKLYSFSGLKKGDSVMIHDNELNRSLFLFEKTGSYIIDSLETINLGNKKIKRYKIKYFEDKFMHFFDGIGSDGAGFNFAPYYMFESVQSLLCAKSNHKYFKILENGSIDELASGSNDYCETLLNQYDRVWDSQITFIQDSEDQIIIQSNEEVDIDQIELYDVNGAKASFKVTDNRIDITYLSKGLHVLRTKSLSAKQSIFKFIK